MSWRKLAGYNAQEDASLLGSPVGYADSQTFAAEGRVRLRKSSGFVSAEAVADKALCATLSIKIVLQLMARTFDECRVIDDAAGGALQINTKFCDVTVSGLGACSVCAAATCGVT